MSICRLHFQANDLGLIDIQDIQSDEIMPPTDYHLVEKYAQVSHTFKRGNTVLGCAGTINLPNVDDKCFVWAFLSKDIRPCDFVFIHKYLKKSLDEMPETSIEMLVKDAIPKTHRWARLLGFHNTKEIFNIDGVEYVKYERIK